MTMKSKSSERRRPASNHGFKPRLMIVINTLETGGAETQVAALAEHLNLRGWRPHLISLLPLCGLAGRLLKSGVRVSSLEMKRGVPDPRAILRLADLVRADRVDILHAHLAQASLLARVVRVLVSVPVVISSMHSQTLTSVKKNSFWMPSWREGAHRLTDRMADVTTTISRAAAQRFLARRVVSAKRLKVIPNGIDESRFIYRSCVREAKRKELGLSEEEFAWLAVGRLELVKDFPAMLQAFCCVSDRSVLLICGAGSLSDQLERMANDLNIQSRVRFLGLRSDVADLMCAADAFLMSSIVEGLPMVLLEAAASELPMVATDVGGNAELVIEGQTGFLSPPSCSKKLTEVMLRMMALSKAERHEMGQTAREHVIQNYSLDHVVELWEKLYIEALRAVTAGISDEREAANELVG